MDNLTHSLIGLAAAKAGLERLSPGATTLCVLAANSPDADLVVLIFGDRWKYLQHHRGITHSIVGTLVLAIALPLVFYGIHWLFAKARHQRPNAKLKGLLVASLLVTATHPIMDWTNNYGMRFLLPWSARWFYGDFVFIIDPFIWMVLGGAAFLLTAKTKRQLTIWIALALVPTYIVILGAFGTGMLPSQILVRILWILALIVLVTLYRQSFGKRVGGKLALAALAAVTIYCGGLAGIHRLALRNAEMRAANIAASNAEEVIKVTAMPTLANPTEWVCLMESDRATYKFNLSLLHNPAGSTNLNSANIVRYEKPSGNDAGLVAKAALDPRSEIFLRFARFPVTRVRDANCLTETLVQFADLRYTEPGKGRGNFSLDVPVECPAIVGDR